MDKSGIHGAGDQMFMLAKRAVDRSSQEGAEAWVAIILSAAAVETFVNDAVGMCELLLSSDNSEKWDRVSTFVSVIGGLEERNCPILLKIELAYFILSGGKQIDKGSLPYQDFDLLIRLRNALVHRKPEWFGKAGKLPKSAKMLDIFVKRQIIQKPPTTGKDYPWVLYAACPRAARWAYNVAVQMVKMLIDLFPGEFKENLTFALGGKVKQIPAPSGK